MKKILFVDDEPAVLAALRRLLRSHRDRWELTLAESATEALALLATQTFDVVVSDMRMPGIDGAELLRRVKQQRAHTIRLILSGSVETADIERAQDVAHQMLAKPCSAADLRACLEHWLAS